MYISKIAIHNFRLLKSVELCLEKQTTLIVGRNNSGKTSLTMLFRRLLLEEEKSPQFKLEDFSLGVHEQFWIAFELSKAGADENKIREALPTIKIMLTIEYKDDGADFGPLADFIIDLDPDCTKAQINILYSLEDGKIKALFKGFKDAEPEKEEFYKSLKELIPKLYKSSIETEDPNDPTNRKPLDFSILRTLLQCGFINAQRALDDTSNKEKAVLGKIFEKLFETATSEAANPKDRSTADDLENAVAEIQKKMDKNFNDQLFKIVPAIKEFGYPGLSDPELCTETTLKVERLLSDYTTVGYKGSDGVNLPESYNGLGPRNLIYILLKLLEHYRSFTTKEKIAGLHLVFIEEPEAHLHPQMQEVFIRKLEEIIGIFSKIDDNKHLWPVQFIVSTHSSHIANEASFDSMRYFLAQPSPKSSRIFTTEVKDLQLGLSIESVENREFLHKYMTLTRCDLLFADRCVLIEGTTERLLLPKMIEKVDEKQPDGMKLSSQHFSVIEVGGAHAHKFFKLLDFLNLKTLIITDIDTVDSDGKKCKVSKGKKSSNSCINYWYSGDGGAKPTKDELLAKIEADKIINNRRLAFQVSHFDEDACGRSFEDAFMLANSTVFNIFALTPEEREEKAYIDAKKIHRAKADFALKYAIEVSDWAVPRYIEEGLRWLSQSPVSATGTSKTQKKAATKVIAKSKPKEDGGA